MQQQSYQRAYEQRLRTIGSQLDSGGYHATSIIEVDGGLVVRASAPGSRTPDVLEIADVGNIRAAQLSPMRSGVPHRLFPEGYKGFLTALGQRLDRSQAAAISIVEGTDFVTVGGIKPVVDDVEGLAYEPLDILLLADDIRNLALLPDVEETPKQQASSVANEDAAPEGESLPDVLVRRVSTLVESALRMVSTTQQAARSRG